MTPYQLARSTTGVVHGIALQLDGSGNRTVCGCGIRDGWKCMEGRDIMITCPQCQQAVWRAQWDQHPAPYIDVRRSEDVIELRSPGGAWVATSLDSINALDREMRDLGIQVREMR